MEIETLNYIIKTYTEVDDTIINAKPKVIKCINLDLKSRRPISISKGDVIYMFNPNTLYYHDIEGDSEFFINIDSIDNICIFDDFVGKDAQSLFSRLLGGN